MIDETDEPPVDNPRRRDGTYLVYDFEGPYDDFPSLLEEIARWVRLCAEYCVDQISVHVDTGWVTASVTVLEIRAGDVMQQLTAAGCDEEAAAVAAFVKECGLREGLRRAGFAPR